MVSKLNTFSFAFSKYSGCGNDFILVDNRTSRFPADNKVFIQRLLNRRHGIGADGLILLENSPLASFKMRIFNPDASEAEMCGNGIRCLIKFASELGLPSDNLVVETLSGLLAAKNNLENVSIKMPYPAEVQLNVKLINPTLEACHLNTGVPHTIIFTDDIENIPIDILGPQIRHHQQFGKNGSNVNWVQVLDQNTIVIRTFERGVEGETLACGTGATAAALASSLKYHLLSPITVLTKSGDALKIEFTDTDVWMTGPAERVFTGESSYL